LVRIGYESIRTYSIQTHDSRSTDGLIGLNGLVGLETKDCFANSPIPSISQSIQASLVNKKKNLQFFKLRILSTSKGIMSERDSKFLGIGGEILCDIY
jgi:ribosomal protein S8